MKKIFFLIVIASVFTACKKNENAIVDDGSLSSDNIIAITNLDKSENNTSETIKSVFNVLGYGYDVTGEFAAPSASRVRIIDLEKLKAEHPDFVQLARTSQGSGIVMPAQNCEALSKMLSRKLNHTDGMRQFRGSITAFFPEAGSLSKKFIYGSHHQELIFRRVYFLNNATTLQNYLLPEFESDVENSSAKELVIKYGTHLLSNIMLGAKLKVLYQAETRNLDRRIAVEKGLTVASRKLFVLNTGLFDYEDDTIAIGNYSQKIRFKTIGGNPQALTEIINPYTNTKVLEVGKWAQSCNKENADFINIGENGITPLYFYIKDAQKKEAVKKYIDNYLHEREVIMAN